MARKRLVSPEFFLHGEMCDAEEATGLPLRLAFIGLWCQADRRGLFPWKPRELKLSILPHDVVNMSDTMSALCRHGFVEYYEVDGKGYGRIPNFGKWQTFNVKEKADLRLPEPLTEFPTSFNPPNTVPAPCRHGVSTPGTGTGTGTGTKELLPVTADAAPALSLVAQTPKPARPRKEPPAFPHFPKALCDHMHTLWVSTFGACEYPRFRKAFGPLFTIAEGARAADAPTDAELAAALKSYADLAPMGAAARFANVNHAAGCLAAIARTRRELAEAPDRRSDAVMRIIHGRVAS